MKGEIFALLAAFTWGCALILFRLSGEQMGPLVLNLFKNLIALVLLLLTLPFTEGFWAPFVQASAWDLALLCLSGFLGIAVADSLLFASLNRVGVTTFSLIDSLYSPSIIVFSWALLGERIGWSHTIGAALIVSGIWLTTVETKPAYAEEEHSSGVPWIGVLYGVLAILTMAFGVVIAKPALQRLPLLWSTTFRLIVGSLALALWLFFTRRDQLVQLIQPHASWRFGIPGAFLGTYLSMIFWLGGYKYTSAAVAGLLNQSTLIFALILSAIFLKETLSRQKLLAVFLTLCGVLTVSLPPLLGSFFSPR